MNTSRRPQRNSQSKRNGATRTILMMGLLPLVYACAPSPGGSEAAEEQFFGFSKNSRDSYVLQFSKPSFLSIANASPMAQAAEVGCSVAKGAELKVGAITEINPSVTGFKGIIDFKPERTSILGFGVETAQESQDEKIHVEFSKAPNCTKELLLELSEQAKNGLLQVNANAYVIKEANPVSESEKDVPVDAGTVDDSEEKVCGLSYPVQKGTWTTVSGGTFGAPRSYPGGHSGHDFAPYGGKNIPIFASALGVTFDVGWHSAYGNRVKIRHPECDTRFTFVTHYAHNSSNIIAANKLRVVAQQMIARAGNTGSASRGVHLHFDLINVARGGFNYVNPLSFMSKGYPQ